jgi:ribonuclease HII
MILKHDHSTKSNCPNLHHENALWENGALWIAGIDEAGRGALAGPVAAAAVVLPKTSRLIHDLCGVKDSKLMSPGERSYWAAEIKELAVTWAVEFASSQEIDRIGILPATRIASIRAVDKLAIRPDCLLIDYINLHNIDLMQISIPRGDRYSLTIAAASILAKTSRDDVLIQLDKQLPGYGFANHKGYGTQAHLEALEQMKPSPVHRMSFAPMREASTVIKSRSKQ